MSEVQYMLKLATRVSVIVLHEAAEDMSPALKTSRVSVLVMFSAKYFCSFCHTVLWQLLWSFACKTYTLWTHSGICFSPAIHCTLVYVWVFSKCWPPDPGQALHLKIFQDKDFVLKNIPPPKYYLSVLAKNSSLTFVFYWFPQIILIVTEVQEMWKGTIHEFGKLTEKSAVFAMALLSMM